MTTLLELFVSGRKIIYVCEPVCDIQFSYPWIFQQVTHLPVLAALFDLITSFSFLSTPTFCTFSFCLICNLHCHLPDLFFCNQLFFIYIHPSFIDQRHNTKHEEEENGNVETGQKAY